MNLKPWRSEAEDMKPTNAAAAATTIKEKQQYIRFSHLTQRYGY